MRVDACVFVGGVFAFFRHVDEQLRGSRPQRQLRPALILAKAHHPKIVLTSLTTRKRGTMSFAWPIGLREMDLLSEWRL